MIDEIYHGMSLEDKICSILRDHPAISMGVLFGSLARGQAHSKSDLDLAVAGSSPLLLNEKMELIEDLATVSGRPVDLIDLQSAGAVINREALLKGKLIYCTDRSLYAEIIKRMIFNESDFLPYRQRILKERRMSWMRD